MKKLLLALSVASLFATSALAFEDVDTSGLDEGQSAPTALPENQGVVNFNGKLIGETCQIKTKNQTVTLPRVDVKDVESGTKTGVTEFNIELTGCSEYNDKFVTLKFTPPEAQLATVGTDKVLKNRAFVAGSNNQGAGNVGLKVIAKRSNGNYNPLVNQDQDYPSLPLIQSQLSKAEVAFPFTVEYIKLGSGNVTPGTVSAALPFTVVYK